MGFDKKIAFLGKLNSIKIDNINSILFEDTNMALMDYDILIFHPTSFYTLYSKIPYEDYNIKNLLWCRKI